MVANRLNNLASVLAEQGLVEEAEGMMRKALAAREKVRPPCPAPAFLLFRRTWPGHGGGAF